MKQDNIDNIDEIFCLLGTAINLLKEDDWSILNPRDRGIDSDEKILLVLDKAKGRIARELSEHYFVRERR